MRIPKDAENPVVTVSIKDVQFPPRPIIEENKCFVLTVMPFAGIFYPDNKLSIDDAFIYGLKIGTCLSTRMELEAEIAFATAEDALGVKGNIFEFGSSFLFNFRAEGTVIPYIAVGGGWLRFQDFSSDDKSIFLNTGGGIRVKPSDHLAFTVEAKDNIAFKLFGKENTHNVQFSVGISWTLFPK